MQVADKIKPCFPLFDAPEYRDTLEAKRVFEERHSKEKVAEVF